MFEKIKAFKNDHKKEIFIAEVSAVTGALLAIVGIKKVADVLDESIFEIKIRITD